MSSARKTILVLLTLAVLIGGCFIHYMSLLAPGGTGRIKGYQYPVPKVALQKALEQAITANKEVHRDTSREDININDGAYYRTVKIYKNGIEYRYTLGYVGTETEWKTSKTSEVCVIYAFANNEGGSEGQGNFDGKKKLKKELIKIVESEVVAKIDSVLGKNHIAD